MTSIARYQQGLFDRWDSWEIITSLVRYNRASPLRRARVALAQMGVPMAFKGRILEFGFGHGQLLFTFQPPTCIFGVELSDKAVRAARARAARRGFSSYAFECPSLESSIRLPFPAEYFDVVLASHSLEHVVDDTAALREFYRVLKPGGRLFVIVPCDAEDNLGYLSREARRNPRYPRESFHVWVYNPRTITEMAKRADFRVVYSEGFDGLMAAKAGWPRVVQRVLSPLLSVVPFAVWSWLDRAALVRGFAPQQALVIAERPLSRRSEIG